LIYFLDSSALVKRYVREGGTDAVARLFRRRSKLAASGLALVEVPSALFRRARQGDLRMDQARAQAEQLAADLDELYVVEPRKTVLELARELVERWPLRTYDAVQLGSAIRLARASGTAVTFTCADRGLASAAVGEGLRALRVA
jgi:predicted nucleic acid-binding protein